LNRTCLIIIERNVVLSNKEIVKF